MASSALGVLDAIPAETGLAPYLLEARERGLSLTLSLRRGGETAQAQVDRLTAEVAARAQQTWQEAQRMLRAVRRRMHNLGPAVGARYRALAESLACYTQRVCQVLHQTRLRLQGRRSIPDRLVSLFDADARPIRRGKLSKPVKIEKIEEGESHAQTYCPRNFKCVTANWY